MSDDFATCNNCGFFEPNTKTADEYLRETMEQIYDYINEIDELDEDVDNERAKAFAEDFTKALKHVEDEETYCKECCYWTTMSWQHIEYNKK